MRGVAPTTWQTGFKGQAGRGGSELTAPESSQRLERGERTGRLVAREHLQRLTHPLQGHADFSGEERTRFPQAILHSPGDQHAAAEIPGFPLHAAGHVHGITHDAKTQIIRRAEIANHHGPRVNADPNIQAYLEFLGYGLGEHGNQILRRMAIADCTASSQQK